MLFCFNIHSLQNRKWCSICGFMFIPLADPHICTINLKNCRYFRTKLGKFNKYLYYCIFCGRFNINCQKVECPSRLKPIKNVGQIEKPFSYNNKSYSNHHNSNAIICLENPNITKQVIHNICILHSV